MDTYSFIDMHIHTQYSDEELCDESPEHIIKKAQEYAQKFNIQNNVNKKCLISFSDHNSILACVKAKTILKSGNYPNVEFVNGCEFTTDLCELTQFTNDKIFLKSHILGYNFDEKNPELLSYSLLTHMYFSQKDNIGEQICAARRQVCEKFGVYIPFTTLLDLTKLTQKANFQEEFFKNVSLFLDASKVKYSKDEFKKIIRANIDYVPSQTSTVTYNDEAIAKCRLKLSEVVKLVKDAGGDVVMAHPALLKVNYKNVQKLLYGRVDKSKNNPSNIIRNIQEHEKVLELFVKLYQKLTGYKLDGMELYHHENFVHDIDKSIKNLCKKYDMFYTCGSDYHGARFKNKAIIGNVFTHEFQNAYMQENNRNEVKHLAVRIGNVSGVRHFKDKKTGYGETVYVNDLNQVVENSVVDELISKSTFVRQKTQQPKAKPLKTTNKKMYNAILNAQGQVKKFNSMLQTAIKKLDNKKTTINNLIVIDKFSYYIYPILQKACSQYTASQIDDYKGLIEEIKKSKNLYNKIIKKYPDITSIIGARNTKNYNKGITMFDKIANLELKEDETVKEQ